MADSLREDNGKLAGINGNHNRPFVLASCFYVGFRDINDNSATFVLHSVAIAEIYRYMGLRVHGVV